MKTQLCLLFGVIGISVMAQTVVIRQPGLVEAVGSAAVGTVRCVGEFATGIVAGSTTVIQTTPAYTSGYVMPVVQPVVATPAPVYVVPQPVVIAPSPVTCAPVVVPCRPCYGPRYVPHGRCYGGPCLGSGRYILQPGPGAPYGPCY